MDVQDGDIARLTGNIVYDAAEGPDWALVPEGTTVKVLNAFRPHLVRVRVDVDDIDEAEGAIPRKDSIIIEITEDDLEVEDV